MSNIPNGRKITLDNGLRIVTEEIPTLRSAAMGILISAGSGNETEKESGISHFIEHMTFKGTKKRSAFEIAHALDAVGGKINAYTGKEQTMYYAVVLDKHIDTAIDVLSDMILNSLYDPKDMDTEKKVVLEEIKMYEDTPDEQVHDLFAQKILHGHPIGKPTIGNEKSVKSFKQKDILNYRKKWYTPADTIISVAGAIPDDLIERIKFFFNNWSGNQTVRHPTTPAIKGSINLKKKKTEQVHLCLGVKGVSQVDEDRYPYALLDNLLGGSMSSRLFQEVREKRGLAYSIFSTSSPFKDFGIAYVYAGTSKESLEPVVNLILEQFSKLKKEGVTKEELEKAREYMKGTLVLGLEATSSRMNWLAKSEYNYGRIMTIDEIFDKVDKVSNDDIIRLADKFFRSEVLTLAVIGDMDKLPIKEIRC
ncbi:MAG: pitrilysin family protein [Candidatus Margulisiibacteriota bacterium]|nr:pitrilysin family protein [Candidatus Margulisiibacteriota bacterium]